MVSLTSYIIPLMPANVILVLGEAKKIINFELLNLENLLTLMFGEEKVSNLVGDRSKQMLKSFSIMPIVL